jgi:hypothetical protein
MMSARVVAGMLVLAGLAMTPTVGEAAPITFTESFTFSDVPFPPAIPAGQAFYIGTDPAFCGGSPVNCLLASATVYFDLINTTAVNPANAGILEGYLVDNALNTIAGPLPQSTQAPTTDASGYVAGSGLGAATLTLGIRGVDPENDNVLVQAFAADGGSVLYQNTFTGALASTPISIALDPIVLALLSSDGQLGIRVSSFGTDVNTHDFNLDSARLDATAVPVPEPSTLLLFGSGAAAAWRRRRR